MVNFCSVANCSNSSRNRPDLSFFCFPSGHFRRLWKNFCRRCDPEFQNQKTLGFAAHTSRLHPSKSRFAEEKKLFQVNYRNILIPRPTNVVFLPVKRDWRTERDVLLMKNVLNLKREALPRKTKTFVS